MSDTVLFKDESIEVSVTDRGSISYAYNDPSAAMHDLYGYICHLEVNAKLAKKERDELAARVERLESALDEWHGVQDNSDGIISRRYPHWVCDLLEESPAASLKLHDADVLMDLAGSITDPALWLGDDMFNHILEEAGRLRQEAK